MDKTLGRKKKKFSIGEYGILVVLIGLWALIAMTNEYFRKPENIMNIFREASFFGIAAIGMTFVIMIRGIDLSVGAMLSLLAVVAALILPSLSIVFTIIVTCFLGAVCGYLNGLLVVKVRIPPFITTLGTYQIFRSIAYMLTKNETNIVIKDISFTKISNGGLFATKEFTTGVPYVFLIFLFFTIVGTILLKNMTFGRSILAIGNSEKASYIAGIKVDRTKILAYTLLGFFVAISAIL